MNEFLKFEKMVSPAIIRFLYLIGVLALIIMGFVYMVRGPELAAIGLLILILGNIIWRILCENLILMFSMHDAVVAIKQNMFIKESVNLKNFTTEAQRVTDPEKPPKKKIPLSDIEKKDLYIGTKAFDRIKKNYLGKIAKINLATSRCTIKNDFGDEIERKISEVMVSEI